MMNKIVLNLMIWILWRISSVDSKEIGVVLQQGGYSPKSTTDTAIKINGREFELYCSADEPIELCGWNWPSHPKTCFSNDPAECSLRNDGNKCIISFSSFSSSYEGNWQCILLHSNGQHINFTSPFLKLATLAQANILLSENQATLQESEMKNFSCYTENAIYRDDIRNKILEWRIDGNEVATDSIITNYYYDCATPYTNPGARQNENNQLCHYESRLQYHAKLGDHKISCQAFQSDSFNEEISSNLINIFLTIVPNSNGDLSDGAKISIGILIPLLIILIIGIILAFWFGWFCFKGRKKEEKSEILEVNDRPKTIENIISEHGPVPVFVEPNPYKAVYNFNQQPLQYKPWPILDGEQPVEVDDGTNNVDFQDNFAPDEFLIYKWEGFGQNSNSGSLSSLDSFGHVDDLELSNTLISLAYQEYTLSSQEEEESIISSFEEELMDMPMPHYHNSMDTWV